MSVTIILTSSFDIHAASYSASDMRQAEKFISSLPVACSGSYITTKQDGTVVINIRCKSSSDSTNGVIEIKNGIVKQVR